MSTIYSDVDRLILERWDDVRALVEAQRGVQDRVEEVVAIVGERLGRWAQPQGFTIEVAPRESDFHAWPVQWHDNRRGERV